MFAIGDIMITYKPFYETLKAKNIPTYKLINSFGVSRRVEEIIEYVDE